MTKSIVTVSINGGINSGRTAIMQTIMRILANHNFETDASWVEGETPSEDPPLKKMISLANRTKVVVQEIQQNRPDVDSRHESFGDFTITVAASENGVIVAMKVLGTVFQSNFGTLPRAQERARSVALRLGRELGVDVQDLIPRDYEQVQPR